MTDVDDQDEIYNKDLYFVAVKLFLRDGDRLLITHDIYGAWDLPGGRIRKNEFDAPLETVIKRKMLEELGPEVRYESREPVVFFRVQRSENGLGGQQVRIFAVGYDAKYLSGEVKIDEHHDQMEWVDVKTFKPDDYFVGGWLTGVQEYLAKRG
jgi:8-oxo-dGTP pyrophosphatase MutT (NUDIX family)